MNKPIATFELYPGATPELDFVVVNHGTVVTFTPLTLRGEDWWSDNVQNDPTMQLGRTHAVDRNMADPILAGMQDAGLRI